MNHLCLIGALREGTAIDAPIVGWVPPLLTGYVTCESARVEPIRTCGIGTRFANFGDSEIASRQFANCVHNGKQSSATAGRIRSSIRARPRHNACTRVIPK